MADGISYRLKEDWKGHGGSGPIANALNAIAQQLNNAEVVSGGTCRPTEYGLRIETSGFPWDRMVNGFTVQGANVTIIEPEIQVGAETPISASDLTIEITADYQYIGIQFNWSSWILSGWGPSLTKPASDATYLRRWLYQFRLQGGRASLHRCNLLGVHVPAAYGDAS